MSNYCANCGKETEDGKIYCKDCEAKAGVVPASDAKESKKQQKKLQKEQKKAAKIAQKSKPEKVVGFWTYIGLFVLYSLPIIGFIFCFVMCFAAGNRNIRHFSSSYIVIKLVALILFAVCVFAFIKLIRNFAEKFVGFIIKFVGKMVGVTIKDAFTGENEIDINDILDQINESQGSSDLPVPTAPPSSAAPIYLDEIEDAA